MPLNAAIGIVSVSDPESTMKPPPWKLISNRSEVSPPAGLTNSTGTPPIDLASTSTCQSASRASATGLVIALAISRIWSTVKSGTGSAAAAIIGSSWVRANSLTVSAKGGCAGIGKVIGSAPPTIA